MTGVAAAREHARLDAAPIVPDAQPELLAVVANVHFDLVRLRMPERVAQRLGGNPVDLVSEDRREIARRALHVHVESGTMRAAAIAELLTECVEGPATIARHGRRRAKALHGVSSFDDRAVRPLHGSV